MAARTTVDLVKEIVTTTLGDSVILGLINAASKMIDNQTTMTSTLDDDTLTEIERWLTAHLIMQGPNRFTTEEKVGEASAKYAGKFGEGLKSTSYGQMVITLDTTGVLSKLGYRQANITAITSFEE